VSAVSALLLAVPATGGGHGGSKSGVFPLIIGVLFVIVGSLNVVNRQLSWRMRSWQYKNKEAQEPSDLALKVARVGGVLVSLTLSRSAVENSRRCSGRSWASSALK
jgi:hypothetical protein